ncbi:MAG: AraC family transcriptional regulator, partial [Verrucomicrobiota bacterium]
NYTTGAELSLRRRKFKLDPQNIYLVPPDTPCMASFRKPFLHFYLHFIAPPILTDWRRDIVRISRTRRLLSLIDSLVKAIKLEGGFHPVDFSKMMLLVIENLEHVPYEVFEFHRQDKRVSQLVDWMRNTTSKKISNQALAGMVAMNPNAFIRLFKEQVGATPQEFFLKIKIEEACRLLHHTRMSIDEIAESLGFCDRYHFSRVFKKFRSVGPATFRKTGCFWEDSFS